MFKIMCQLYNSSAFVSASIQVLQCVYSNVCLLSCDIFKKVGINKKNHIFFLNKCHYLLEYDFQFKQPIEFYNYIFLLISNPAQI